MALMNKKTNKTNSLTPTTEQFTPEATQTCTFPDYGVAVTVGVAKINGKTGIAVDAKPAAHGAVPSARVKRSEADNASLITPHSSLKKMTSIDIAKALTEKTNVEYIPMGGTTVARKKADGTFEVVESNDPVVKAILQRGSLYNQHLFKQHVLAQFLKQQCEQTFERNYIGEVETDSRGRAIWRDKTYQEVINDITYEYMLKMLWDELLRQMQQQKQNDVNFIYNNRWYDKELVAKVITHYVEVALTEQIGRTKTKHCGGEPYKVVAGLSKVRPEYKRNMIFLADLVALFAEYRRMASRIRRTKTAKELFEQYDAFYKKHIKIQSQYEVQRYGRTQYQHTETPAEWRDAYKGYGAYWSMQNLIEFHGCKVVFHNDKKVEVLTGGKALWYLNAEVLKGYNPNYRTKEEKKSGWWFTGMLRQMMQDNNIDPKQMLDSWKK